MVDMERSTGTAISDPMVHDNELFDVNFLAQMERMWRQPVQITQHEFGMRKAENRAHCHVFG